MRLFIALEIPAAVRENLAAVQNKLPITEAGIRWVRPENFHVTLKFIGEISREKLEVIADELKSVRADGPVELRIRGLGYAWKAKGAGVFWATIEASDSLKTLAGQIDRCLEPLGVTAEDRAFLPHLTLARFKHRRVLPAIRAMIDENEDRDFGSGRAEEFHLMESKLGPAGSKYSTVASFPFGMTADA